MSLNARIERMATRLGGKKGFEKLLKPLSIFSIFERTMFVCFLERYPSFVSYLFTKKFPFGLDVCGAQASAMVADTFGLKKSKRTEGRSGRRLSELQVGKLNYWSLAKSFDAVLSLYAFIFFLMDRVRGAAAEPSKKSLSDVVRDTAAVLKDLLEMGTNDGVATFCSHLGTDRFPQPAFTERQYRHWISRFDDAFLGVGQKRGHRLSEWEIRQLFGSVVDKVNWAPPLKDESMVPLRTRKTRLRGGRTVMKKKSAETRGEILLARKGRHIFRASLGSGLYAL